MRLDAVDLALPKLKESDDNNLIEALVPKSNTYICNQTDLLITINKIAEKGSIARARRLAEKLNHLGSINSCLKPIIEVLVSRNDPSIALELIAYEPKESRVIKLLSVYEKGDRNVRLKAISKAISEIDCSIPLEPKIKELLVKAASDKSREVRKKIAQSFACNSINTDLEMKKILLVLLVDDKEDVSSQVYLLFEDIPDLLNSPELIQVLRKTLTPPYSDHTKNLVSNLKRCRNIAREFKMELAQIANNINLSFASQAKDCLNENFTKPAGFPGRSNYRSFEKICNTTSKE
jgi:hypothetical protein